MDKKEFILHWIEANAGGFCDLAHKIWQEPEISFYEFRSSKLQADFLEKEGFKITWDLGGMNTAFMAEWGEGKPCLGFIGEFDALRGLSQVNQPVKQPVSEGAPGHACGHNLLGTGALAATLAAKTALEEFKLPGTLRYYGCPAEEDGGGKLFMVREGLFSDLDAAFNYHPMMVNFSSKGSVTAVRDMKYLFHGITAHAGAAPHLGRSALDAVELMNVGVNYLREHVPTDVRMHYVITDGGQAPNIVPLRAEAWYYLRAHQAQTLADVAARVEKVAQGAAMMTETRLETIFKSASSNMLNNTILADLQYANMQYVGPIRYTDEEMAFARDINVAYPADTAQAVALSYHVPTDILRTQDLVGKNYPSFDEGKVMAFSTDVGDLSWNVPLSMLMTTCFPTHASFHTWGAAAAAGTSIGHKGMLHAAKIMALSALDLIQNTDILQRVRAEFEQALRDQPYHCPIPDSLKPPKIHNPVRNVD